MRLHFLNISWGAEYCRMFVESMLPTLLSPGNLALPELAGQAKFVLYTTPADFELIDASPAFRRLRQLMEVDVLDMGRLRESMQGSSKYAIMNACHCHAIQRVNEDDAAIVFLHPDFVITDGFCRGLLHRLDEGKSVVLLSGSHVSRTRFLDELRRLRGGDLARLENWAIAPREMVSLACKTLNRYSLNCFWDTSEVSLFPNKLWWRVGEAGFFQRCLHGHPVMVKPAIKGILPQKTFDDDFLEGACPDLATYHFVEDSDEMSIFALSPENEFPEDPRLGTYSAEAIAAYVLSDPGFRRQHHLFLRKIFRHHSGDLDEEWARVEAESTRQVSAILRLVAAQRALEFPVAHWAKEFRRHLDSGTPVRA